LAKIPEVLPRVSHGASRVWKERRYIIGCGRGWQLTAYDDNPDLTDNGFSMAFLIWAKRRELYGLIGLKGPPLEALGIKPGAEGKERPGRKGMEVEIF